LTEETDTTIQRKGTLVLRSNPSIFKRCVAITSNDRKILHFFSSYGTRRYKE